MRRSTTLAVFIVLTALSGAVVVLLIPGLVGGVSSPGWLWWVSVGVLVSGGAGTVLVRRSEGPR